MIFQYTAIVILLIFGIIVFRGAPYVPSQKKYALEAFTKLYKLSADDVLLDVGSGDGLILRLASKFGTKAIGYELNPVLFALSWLMSIGDKNIKVKFADLWLTSIPNNTTVIYIFAVSRDVRKMVNMFQLETNRLGRKMSVISYGNELPGAKLIKKINAYHLYQLSPLHESKAQV